MDNNILFSYLRKVPAPHGMHSRIQAAVFEDSLENDLKPYFSLGFASVLAAFLFFFMFMGSSSFAYMADQDMFSALSGERCSDDLLVSVLISD